MKGAIEDLYAAFAGVRRRPQMDVCPHCKITHIPGVALRELSAEDLGRYAFKAMTTWGEVDDFRHFLPRLFELALTGAPTAWPGLDLECLCGKLAYGRWATWAAVERTAIERVLHALWRRVLATSPEDGPAATRVLRALERATEVGPFVDVWLGDDSATAAWHLAEAVLEGRAPKDARIAAALMAAFERFHDEGECGARIAEALDRLRS